MIFLRGFVPKLIKGPEKFIKLKVLSICNLADAFLFYIVIQNKYMDIEKLQFLTKDCLPLFKNIKGEAMGNWGIMNGQQMVEHVAAFFAVSTGKIKFDLVTPLEHLPKYREFLLSDKDFRENTKAPASLIGEEALPLHYANMEEALVNMKQSIADFEDFFKDDKLKTTLHPVFGELNFDEWVLLHYKHVRHHLKQFELLK